MALSMPTLNLTTPALLFPAISLVLLAYGNRFLALGQIVRQLHPGESGHVTDTALRQLPSLRLRIELVKYMQSLGALAFLLCALAMLALYFDNEIWGHALFGISIASLSGSLLLSLAEILVSTKALGVVLEDIERQQAQSERKP